MARKKLIYGLQLPHPSHTTSNIPLALGYLAAYLAQTNIAGEVQMRIAPSEVNDAMGDSQLIRFLCDMHPDLLAFSVYPWNIERTISLSRRIKARLGCGVSIVFGGPEIHPQNPEFQQHAGADYLITGEGETPFVTLVDLALFGSHDVNRLQSGASWNGKNYAWCASSPLPLQLDLLPSPYLQGMIPMVGKTAINIFSYRGCWFRCKYCQWQTGKPVRPFPWEQVRAELEFAITRRIPTIYISDAAFNLSPHFERICDLLKAHRDSQKAVRCFVHLGSISARQASDLAGASINGVEAGLQCIDSSVNKAINRQFDQWQFERGYTHLCEHGVSCITDVMLGLPLSNAASVEDTVAYVAKLRMPYSLFHLSVPSGSALHVEQANYGMKIQAASPYYVLSTNRLGRNEIAKLHARYFNASADKDPCVDIGYPGNVIDVCRKPDGIEEFRQVTDLDSGSITDWIIWNGDSEGPCIDLETFLPRSGLTLSVWFIGNALQLRWRTFFDELADRFTQQEKFGRLYIYFQLQTATEGFYPWLNSIDERIYRRDNFLFRRDEFLPSRAALSSIRNDSGHACLISSSPALASQTPQHVKTLLLIDLARAVELSASELGDDHTAGFCITTQSDPNRHLDMHWTLDCMRSIKACLPSSHRIYFCDPVLHRLWLQKVWGFTASPMRRHMVIFTPTNTKAVTYTDYDLAFDAILHHGWTTESGITDHAAYFHSMVARRLDNRTQAQC